MTGTNGNGASNGGAKVGTDKVKMGLAQICAGLLETATVLVASVQLVRSFAGCVVVVHHSM
eukprot:scaffold2918_cov230-Alexandrium_tamarense.AAC.12